MKSEPATKAEVEAAIDVAIAKAVAPLATKADLERYATKADLERYATKADLERYATKADLAAAIEPLATKADLERYATKSDLEAWGMAILDRLERMIDVTIGRAMRAVTDDFHRSLLGHAELVSTDVAAANANAAQVRADLEAHRDDAQVHRAPRRRRS